MNLELYEPKVRLQSHSMISGDHDLEIDHTELPKDIPVLQEFLKDDDLQRITDTSTNIGFTHTYSKRYRQRSESSN